MSGNIGQTRWFYSWSYIQVWKNAWFTVHPPDFYGIVLGEVVYTKDKPW